ARVSGFPSLCRRERRPRRRHVHADHHAQPGACGLDLGPGRIGGGGRAAARAQDRPGDDGVRARTLPRARVLQEGAVLEPRARAGTRVLRRSRLRASRLQLQSDAIVEEAANDLPLLSVRGVAKSYGARRAIVEASFELWPGEVLAVVGESGSGKTTL